MYHGECLGCSLRKLGKNSYIMGSVWAVFLENWGRLVVGSVWVVLLENWGRLVMGSVWVVLLKV